MLSQVGQSHLPTLSVSVADVKWTRVAPAAFGLWHEHALCFTAREAAATLRFENTSPRGSVTESAGSACGY